MTPKEFANKIREKYPNAYDNISDDELTQRVISKYPVYKSQVDIGSQSTTPTDNSSQSNYSPGFDNTLGKVSTGVAKGIFAPLVNLGKAITNQTAGRVVNAISGKGFVPTVDNNQLVNELNKPSQSTSESIGNFAGQVGSLALGSGEVAGLTKSLPLIPKVLSRALGTGAIVAGQEGKIGLGSGIVAGAEIAFPIAGAFIKPVSRLFKSLASGISGQSSKAIESIIAEPYLSKSIAKNIDLGSSESILTKNTETFINGVSKVRQEARNAYGTAIKELKATDINQSLFRNSIQQTLDNYGSQIKNGKRVLSNIEFDNPTMVNKANSLIDKLSSTKLDGFSLNKLSNEIESSMFKTTGGDAQRLSFNAFLNDLSSSVKKAISASTDKLNVINKAYSTDLQLTDAIESIFGKVTFKNTKEILKASQRLEQMFAKTGLAPKTIDDFLTRIGVKPSEFRASEAVRKITDVQDVANSKGISFTELLRSVSSSVITPKAIRDASILTGIAQQRLLPILNSVAPTARASLIRLLVEAVNKLGQTTSQ